MLPDWNPVICFPKPIADVAFEGIGAVIYEPLHKSFHHLSPFEMYFLSQQQVPLVMTVWADPSDPPLSLLFLLPQLEKDFKVHCSVHRHSSVSSLPDSPFVRALNNLLPHPTDDRMGVQLSIMLIWKIGELLIQSSCPIAF